MSKTAGEVISKVKSFIHKMMRPYKDFCGEEYVIEKLNNKEIEVRTDSMIYDLIYDPSMADFPTYKDSERFYALIEKLGWRLEHDGGGVIHLYKG
jgi:hypothetical protein